MSKKVSYVYPNVSSLNRKGRGGLLKRWALAVDIKCDYIEMPGDLIKNKTECILTGKPICDFLDIKDISILYEKEILEKDANYIMHTEPSIPRTDTYGLHHQASLKWFDKGWTRKFALMIINISDFLGTPPSIIEIHPGDQRNSNHDLVESMIHIIEMYSFNNIQIPLFMVENRTGQFIQNGENIRDFYGFLYDNHQDLLDKIRLVLDVQQLFTATKEKFKENIDMIPIDAIKGVHIHQNHNVPDINGPIDWNYFFTWLSKSNESLIINPEVLNKNKVQDTISFCDKMLSSIKE